MIILFFTLDVGSEFKIFYNMQAINLGRNLLWYLSENNTL